MKMMLQIFAVSACTVSVCAVIRKFNSELTVPILVVGCAVIASLALSPIEAAVNGVTQLVNEAGFGGYFETLLKALGCAFTAQTAADICRDAGESALASKVELAGRAELLLIAVPIAAEVVETAYILSGV